MVNRLYKPITQQWHTEKKGKTTTNPTQEKKISHTRHIHQQITPTYNNRNKYMFMSITIRTTPQCSEPTFKKQQKKTKSAYPWWSSTITNHGTQRLHHYHTTSTLSEKETSQEEIVQSNKKVPAYLKQYTPWCTINRHPGYPIIPQTKWWGDLATRHPRKKEVTTQTCIRHTIFT